MFAAPIQDLREALLLRQSLGPLNPRPWAVMTGNCLGWVAYGYYVKNPFLIMSNLPGLILSVWLNTSASQLEYHTACQAQQRRGASSGSQHCQQRRRPLPQEQQLQPEEGHFQIIQPGSNYFFDNPSDQPQQRKHHGSSHDDDDGGYQNTLMPPLPPPIVTEQQVWWLRVWIVWAIILLWVGWITPWHGQEAAVVGWAVNLNLVFFYAAPLQSIQHVLTTGSSESIHSGYVNSYFCHLLSCNTYVYTHSLIFLDPSLFHIGKQITVP